MINKKGFTLIELLVVIAIIGLLSSVVLASLSTARSKARDTRRISDVKQMQIALESFFNETGRYPTGGWHGSNYIGSVCGVRGKWMYDSTTGSYNWTDKYFTAPPEDPQNVCRWPWTGGVAPSDPAMYAYYGPDGKTYVLVVKLENSSDPKTLGVNDVKWYDGLWLKAQHGWHPNSYVIFGGL